MRKTETVKEERKPGVQQLRIIDMGQEGDITRYKKISNYISIHTEAQSAVDMSTSTYAHIRIVFHWRQAYVYANLYLTCHL